jgi:hypothetical protein
MVSGASRPFSTWNHSSSSETVASGILPPERAPGAGEAVGGGPEHRCLVRCGGLAVVSPQPVGVVRYGALDVVLRPEAGVGPQPGGVEVVVRGPVGVAALRKRDVRARDRGVDRGDDVAVAHEPSGRDVVDAVVEPLREHEPRDWPGRSP